MAASSSAGIVRIFWAALTFKAFQSDIFILVVTVRVASAAVLMIYLYIT